MKSEKLLKAIGNIDDEFVTEAAPDGLLKRKIIPWTRYGSLVAGFCICFVGLWLSFTILEKMGDGAKSEPSMEEEAPVMEEAVVEEEAAAEEEVPAEWAPPAEESVEAEDEVAEDTVPEESANGSHDIAYGFVLNGRTYYPISFEERKLYGLVPEEDAGLTVENTYHITESDLGEAIGTIESSDNESLIGAAVYHFAKFPESDDICIVKTGDSYEFYVSNF